MLTLPIKGKWFDMIESGEKREEYRELSPYYTARFAGKIGRFKIKLRRGYCGDDPTLECVVSIKVGRGKPEWGAPKDRDVYILKIHSHERVDAKRKIERPPKEQSRRKRSAISLMDLHEVMRLLCEYNRTHERALSYGQFVAMEESK